MTHSGTRRPATALAAWYENLPTSEQKRLNTDLYTKSKAGDLRRNFRDGMRDMGQLKLTTITFLRANYGMAFSLDGQLMGEVKFIRPRQLAYA